MIADAGTFDALLGLVEQRPSSALERLVARGDILECGRCRRDSRDGVNGWETRPTGHGYMAEFVCARCVAFELAGEET